MELNPLKELISTLGDDRESHEEASKEIIEEVEKLRETLNDDPGNSGFTPDLITDYYVPTQENIFLDENILIAVKDNKNHRTTAYFEVENSEDSDVLGGDSRYYKKLDLEESVEEITLLLEKAINQEREIFYPSTFTGTHSNENYNALVDLLDKHGRPVEVTPLEFSKYPEDAGIAVEAMERDAVVVTYDADFTDDEDFVMQYLREVYTPSQMYNSIK